MADHEGTTPEVESFINRWLGSGAAERSNYQLFLSGLCRLLGVPEPEPATADDSCFAIRPENLRAWENNQSYHALRF